MPSFRTPAVSIIAFLLVAFAASAHTLKTARGAVVNHTHFTGDCIPGTRVCGSAWQTVEKQMQFKATDRMYSGTIAWNCHGRTFDFRRSWVPLADDFLRTDGPMCPAKPTKGDTIIWIYGSADAAQDGAKVGNTKHSVTIDGPWLGLDTVVVSKYGAAAQYRHILRNSVNVYGSRWSVTRFGAGTSISANAVELTGDERASQGDVRVHTAEELIAARSSMPWYDAVLESEMNDAAALKERIRAAGALLPNTVAALEFAAQPTARIALLISDLMNDEHYALLSMYNFPEPQLLTGFVAADELRSIAHSDRENYADVLSTLSTIALDLATPDAVRGEALHALLGIADRADADAVAQALEDRGVLAASGDASYTSYFARRLRSSEPLTPFDRKQ